MSFSDIILLRSAYSKEVLRDALLFTEVFNRVVPKFNTMIASKLSNFAVVEDFIFFYKGNDFISSVTLFA